ncbi:hypothetical protein [Actinoplanes palleronii]|uniref:Uncharacterized protein n=1 Tax=Actinoplanes palleronii TaxID=113570 RepID=A0ABQ4BCT6_9ACTN|nr:hypothetical protein [Actinoplanes palleronii]GIE68459.1 hypothetical protein Apa02nite_045670 [Actinoplanes palleronii]
MVRAAPHGSARRYAGLRALVALGRATLDDLLPDLTAVSTVGGLERRRTAASLLRTR